MCYPVALSNTVVKTWTTNSELSKLYDMSTAGKTKKENKRKDERKIERKAKRSE